MITRLPLDGAAIPESATEMFAGSLPKSEIFSPRATGWQFDNFETHKLDFQLTSTMFGFLIYSPDGVARFPFLTLLVSGGHTMVVLTEGMGSHTILGERLSNSDWSKLYKSVRSPAAES